MRITFWQHQTHLTNQNLSTALYFTILDKKVQIWPYKHGKLERQKAGNLQKSGRQADMPPDVAKKISYWGKKIKISTNVKLNLSILIEVRYTLEFYA